MNKVEEVYSIFQEYFGEYRTDLQKDDTSHYILVMFDNIVVTNERNQSTNIEKMFAKVYVTENGTMSGTFSLLRTIYSELHFRSGYRHSHIPRLYADNLSTRIKRFETPCLGQGPISKTCTSLNIEFDEYIWRLFCVELEKYVGVESLSGGPYYNMSQIGSTDILDPHKALLEIIYNLNLCVIDSIKVPEDFIKYIFKSKKLRFYWESGMYRIAMSKYELIITLSDLFIEWHNNTTDSIKNLYNRFTDIATFNILNDCICLNGKIFKKSNININNNRQRLNIEDYIGTPLINFKGELQVLEIADYVKNKNKKEVEEKPIKLLSTQMISLITRTILNKINYELIRDTQNYSKDQHYYTIISKDAEVV